MAIITKQEGVSSSSNKMTDNLFDQNKSKLFEGYQFDKEGFENLFHELDADNNGRIGVDELSNGLKRLGIDHLPDQAQKIIDIGDVNNSDELSFDEFLKYCHDHERKVWLVFKKFDTNNSGSVTKGELKSAFQDLGVKVSDGEINLLLKKMDKDGSLQIDWDEWRMFHLLNPHAHNIKHIIRFWRHSTFIDIGDDMVVPDDFTEEEKLTGMWWRQLMAGGLAGVVSRTCTAPLDRLKVLLQVHSGAGEKNWGIKKGFHKMMSEGGFKSLWRGNYVNCIKIAPESSIKFFAYEYIKPLLKGDETCTLGPRERFIAGSSAGIISQSLIYPMEVLKTRLALGKTGQYKNLADCARKVLNTDGMRGFYKGLLPNLIGVVPYAGIDLCVYETLKMKWLSQHDGVTNPGILVLLLCGSTSSTCGMLASYPLALVRTKLQAQTNNPKFTGLRADGMVDMFRTIVRENGYTGLYRGLLPNFMKVAPAVGISYVVYENVRRELGMT